ncbi:MAG: hypothetical protein J6R94_04710 [Agathobacter sp.]|nr:hypothetical protein [Agathobacter sp.]
MKNKVIKGLCLLLTAGMLLSLAACGGNGEGTENTENSETVQTEEGSQNTEDATNKVTQTEETETETVESETEESESEESESEETQTQEQESESATEDNNNQDSSQLGAGQVVDCGSFWIIDRAGYEAYGYSENVAKAYANAINKLAAGTDAKVYTLLVPMAGDVVLPDAYKGKIKMDDNKASIDKVSALMEDEVTGLNVTSNLLKHKNEYLYFYTDHHWTQRGAYYAYQVFCESKGISYNALESYKKASYSGFYGSFYFENKHEILKAHPDTVDTWTPLSPNTMTVTDINGKEFTWPLVNDVSDYKAGTKYSAFIAGDNPFTVIDNETINDGSSCVVIKDSYGNAFVPYLTDHYDKVYVVDFRYWTGSLIDFVNENEIDDVLFVNGLSTLTNSYQVGKIRAIIE